MSLVLALTNPGDLVFDPFAGVASAGVAAALHARRFWGCELNAGYAKTGHKRLQETLDGTIRYEAQLRQALLDYIDIEHPSWVQNASFGRSRVISFAGSQIAQVFAEAGLADGTSEAVVAFWDALAARARGQRDDRLTQIGRLGERLTIDYEAQRTGRRPSWIAIDNNADRYDVLSIVGPANPRQLTIEVKTSTQGTVGFAMLTRNE